MKLLQSHRRVQWLTDTIGIGINIAFILVAVSKEYFTASLSKVNYTGTSAERLGSAIPKGRHSETARHSKGLSPQKPD